MVLGRKENGSILGLAQVKRWKRIAEACSRHMTHHLEDRIRSQAKALTACRAVERAIPVHQLVSTEEELFEDFVVAERLVAHSFRQGCPVFTPEQLRIDDVIGIKFVCSAEEMDRAEQAIRNHPLVMQVERKHQSSCNDINLVVELQVPPAESLIDRERHRDWTESPWRGLSADELAEGFPEFLASGARTFCVEVILTTQQDLLKSEFGPSIHKSTGLAGGHIAENASFLIEYMFTLALSPTVDFWELPVKMWGRTLPGVHSTAALESFGLSADQDQMAFLFPRYHVAPLDGLRTV
jgi:hypothetical protein